MKKSISACVHRIFICSLGNVTRSTEPSVTLNLLNAAAEALVRNEPNATRNDYRNDSCGRLNIMGTIVEDSAPFLYPFVIEYSLIGAAVIFIMWRHIGRSPRLVSFFFLRICILIIYINQEQI